MNKILAFIIIGLSFSEISVGQTKDSLFIRDFADSIGIDLLVAYKQDFIGYRDNQINNCTCGSSNKTEWDFLYLFEDKLYLTSYECCSFNTLDIRFSYSWNLFRKNEAKFIKNEKKIH